MPRSTVTGTLLNEGCAAEGNVNPICTSRAEGAATAFAFPSVAMTFPPC
jgi:hypothetical protein